MKIGETVTGQFHTKSADPISTPNQMCELSIIVMTYNEVQSLEAVVRELATELIPGCSHRELVIVDDGSTDGSAEMADSLAHTLEGVRVIHHACNQGLGGVYRTGFKEARGRYVTFFPADGQYPAMILPLFFSAMTDCDIILGFIKSETYYSLGFWLSVAERIAYRILLGRMPRFKGILMFRKKLLDQMVLQSQGRGWAILMEMIIKSVRAGCRTRSIPIPLQARLYGASKVNNQRTILSNLKQVWALRQAIRLESVHEK
jgi:glycosyltransferase involved in cell wall biosynthesis